MKNLLKAFFCIIIMLLFCSIPVAAYDLTADISESFIVDTVLYLTEETKAGDIKYFGERITFRDADGNYLSADDYLKTGDTLIYFDLIDLYTVVLIGDCDCDGRVTPADARIALRISVNLCEYTEAEKTYGAWDADFSQSIEPSDARLILRVSVGLDTFDEFKTEYDRTMEKYSNKNADYDDKLIIICLNPEFIENEAVYTPEFYGDLVGSVEVFAEYSEKDIWLELHLAEPSKENVDMLINECFKNDAVIIAERNYISYLDFVAE